MKRAAGLFVAVCFLPALMYAQAVAYDYSKLYETVVSCCRSSDDR